jgi:hypothetical protein
VKMLLLTIAWLALDFVKRVLSSDAEAWLHRLTECLVRHVGSRLKVSAQASEDKVAEWLADLEDTPGALGKLWFAVGLIWYVGDLEREILAGGEPKIVEGIGTSSGSSTVIGVSAGAMGLTGLAPILQTWAPSTLNVNLTEMIRVHDSRYHRNHPAWMSSAFQPTPLPLMISSTSADLDDDGGGSAV